MFTILDDKTICLTRGDTANIAFTASLEDGAPYVFTPGEIIRFSVFEKKNCSNVVLSKDTEVTQQSESVMVRLTKQETKIGEIISKPTDYWYEVELNPNTNPQTIVGYDDWGPKVFRLYPEGGGKR